MKFNHELQWEVNGSSQIHDESREIRLHMPYLGILRKTRFAGVSKTAFGKE